MGFLVMLLLMKKEFAGIPLQEKLVLAGAEQELRARLETVIWQSLREVITYFSLPPRGPC